MKTNLSQRICALVCLFAMLTTLAACSKSDDNGGANSQSYTSSYIDIPKEITSISRLLVSENTAYLCCTDDISSYIAAVNIDSGNFQKLPLDIEDGVSLLDFSVNEDGGIWVLCKDSAGAYGLREYGSNWTALVTVDLSSVIDSKVAAGADNQLFLNTDTDGHIGVAIKNTSTYIYVFDAEGTFLFDLFYDGNLMTTVTTAEGKIGVCSAASDRMNYNLLTVDVQNKSWSDELYLGTTAGLYNGQAHSFLLFDGANLYGITSETGERQTILNWSDAGLNTTSVHVSELTDGRLVVASASTNQASALSYEFAVLEQGSDDRTVLSMVSLSAKPSIVQAVSDFNKSNSEYRIELTEYFPYEENVSDDDWENAIANLNTKIISGDIPDILDMSDLSVEIYYNKGVLENLYTYIENDPEISLSDYFENVFDALSINGELPFITNGVSVSTMLADASIVGDEPGWTVGELTALINTTGASSNLTGSTFLKVILETDTTFIDWSTGECYFDTPEFIELLELAGRIQEEKETGTFGSSDSATTFSYETILTVFQTAQCRADYNDNLNIIGLPNSSGVYYAVKPEAAIGISSASNYKDGAWSFVRTLLSEEQQSACSRLPIHKGVFNSVMKSVLDGDSIWGMLYEDVKVTQEDVNLTKALLSSASYAISSNQSLEDIILEEATAFFTGNQTAAMVASSIQNRASLYVNEQM